MGRLTRDPSVNYSAGGNAVARYSLAVDRRFKREGDPDADFFNCTVFGKGAEFAEKYFKQGIKILVTGRIQNDNYTNKDGQKTYSVQILVDEQEFAESKNASSGNVKTATSVADGFDTSNAGDGFINIPEGFDDELPFV